MSGYNGYPYYQGYGANNNYAQRQYSAQPPQMTPMQPQMPQQSPMEMPIQDIKYVNKAQADAYIVFPNTKVMLIDRESGMVYIKAADGMGQSQTEYFRFEPINADGTPIKPQDPTPQVNFEDFVKIDQIKNMGFATVAQYEELTQKLEQMQKKLEGAKQNVGQPKQS